MDTGAMMPDEIAELAALRRRAYGAGADIGTDAAALARLRVLEGTVARAHAPSAPTAVPTTAVPFAAAAPAAPSVRPPVAEATIADEMDPATEAAPDGSVDAAGSPPTLLTRVRRFVRAHPLGVTAGAGVLAIALTGGGVVAARSQPDAVMRPLAEASASPGFLGGTGLFEYLGVGEAAEPEAFGSYGGIEAYALPVTAGGHCMIVGMDQNIFGYGCGRGSLATTVDLIVGTTMVVPDIGFPGGTLVRFIYRGDRVDVWVEEPEGELPR